MFKRYRELWRENEQLCRENQYLRTVIDSHSERLSLIEKSATDELLKFATYRRDIKQGRPEAVIAAHKEVERLSSKNNHFYGVKMQDASPK